MYKKNNRFAICLLFIAALCFFTVPDTVGEFGLGLSARAMLSQAVCQMPESLSVAVLLIMCYTHHCS